MILDPDANAVDLSGGKTYYYRDYHRTFTSQDIYDIIEEILWAKKRKLTNWEAEFLESIEDQFQDTQRLTITQFEKLINLHEILV